jgi:hypothetical protein
VISKPHGWSHDWIRQTPRSFKTTVLDIPQMTSRPCGGSHDWVRQTPQSFEITILKSIIKHRIQTKFYGSLKYEIKECSFTAQEAHTSPKSRHELNIWQRILSFKVRVLQPRLVQQVTKQSPNQDKGTYTSDEQEQLIELSSFSICSTVQTSQVI